MKTRLRVKSNYQEDETSINTKLKEFTDNITGVESSVEHVKDETYNVLCPVYVVEYDDHSELKQVISKFNEHRYMSLDDYEDIMHADFSLSLESENINEAFDHLNSKNIAYLEEQINMLDYISSDIVSEQEEMKDKVDAIYSFMQKSGIIYYKQMVEGLLDVMDHNGLVDKDKLQKTMFKEVH